MLRKLLLVALLVTMLFASEAAAISRSASQPYQLATGFVYTNDDPCDRSRTTVNAVCFVMYDDERWVTLRIADDTQRSIAVKYVFRGGGLELSSGHFCGGAAKLKAPPGADYLILFMGDAGKIDGSPLPGCQFQRGVGGIVTADFL